jgi:hypothetical protein
MNHRNNRNIHLYQKQWRDFSSRHLSSLDMSRCSSNTIPSFCRRSASRFARRKRRRGPESNRARGPASIFESFSLLCLL